MPPPELASVTLAGFGIRLVPLQPAHRDGLWAALGDPEIWRWTAAHPENLDEMGDYIDDALTKQKAGHALPFATLITATGEIAGTTRFGEFSAPHLRVEIGWTALAAKWQRSFVNSAAKYLMLRHAFENLGLNRVEFKTDALNAASRTAIARLGAREEGVLRSHMVTQSGRRRDTVYYSILKEEWPAICDTLLKKL